MSNQIDLALLSRHVTLVTNFKQGDLVFRTGEPARELYVVKEGEIDIVLDGSVIETVTSGEIFGEIALVDASPRSADAICQTDVVVVPITEYQFLRLIENMPFFALDVMRTLTARLRRMNELKLSA